MIQGEILIQHDDDDESTPAKRPRLTITTGKGKGKNTKGKGKTTSHAEQMRIIRQNMVFGDYVTEAQHQMSTDEEILEMTRRIDRTAAGWSPEPHP